MKKILEEISCLASARLQKTLKLDGIKFQTDTRNGKEKYGGEGYTYILNIILYTVYICQAFV